MKRILLPRRQSHPVLKVIRELKKCSRDYLSKNKFEIASEDESRCGFFINLPSFPAIIHIGTIHKKRIILKVSKNK
jgi:hypothetical protein